MQHQFSLSLGFLLMALLDAPVAWSAESQSVTYLPDQVPEVRVRAKAMKLHDELSYTPHSVAIEQPASDVDLGETLSKLPGVLVRNVSGYGSATTVITSQALGSASTAVSIDDIPVLDPVGRGVNFSIFPSSLIGSIEHHSPFYPSVDPSGDTLPAPGGRINLRTMTRHSRAFGSRSVSPWATSILVGSGNTAEFTGAYTGGDRKSDWLLGVSGFNTSGDFRYENPINGNNEERMNNNAAGVGALAKYNWKLKSGGSIEVLDLFSNQDRTNPGDIHSPRRDHQKDMFNLVGVRYHDPEAISARDGLFAKVAGAYSRTATRVPVEYPGQADSTDSRGWGHYTQFGYVRKDESSSMTLTFDNQYAYVRKDEGVFNQNVFGATATMAVDVGKFRIVPLGRQDASNRFPSAGDGSISVTYSPDSANDVTLAYGLQHIYPSITAKSGFNLGGFNVLPNDNLLVQRDNITTLSYVRRHSKYTLFASAFYDLVRNRVTFARGQTPGSYQFVNSSSVSVLGYSLDGQVFPSEKLALRSSLSVARAWDRTTGHEMPYKPRFEGWGSISYLFVPEVGLTLQEQFVGKRFTDVRGVETMSPFAQTHVRLDLNLWDGVAFVKVSNLFNEGAFENPGYPFPGRTYWMGYTL